jgi:hypothetical protein
MSNLRWDAGSVCSILIALCIACWSNGALAGAWTLPAGDTQIISGAILSSAAESFDDSGGTVPTYYRKLLLQSYDEHGLTDNLTLILSPEYAIATEGGPDRPTIHADDFALKGGVRYLLTDLFGVLVGASLLQNRRRIRHVRFRKSGLRQ